MKRWVLWGALVPGAIGLAFAACGDNGGVGEIFDDGGTGTTQRDGSSGFGDDGSSPGDDSAVILPSDSGGGDTGGNTHDQFVWPDCSSKPVAATTQAITDIWTANYTTPTEVWISGAYVTAVSRNGCTAGQACQIFLQTDLTYATLADGAHHGIKMFVSAAAAEHLVGIAVGDKVDALGYAWRYNLDGQNELLVQVNLALPGCAKKTGTGTPAPITAVSLNELSVVGYEQTYGPLLVEVATVSGTPAPALTDTFGLFPTFDAGGFDAGGADIVSLSPFFLPGATFVDPPMSQGRKDFASVTGVFGLFVPPLDGGTTTKYVEIYPRSASAPEINVL